jgi:hypothetical protein
MDPSLIMKIGRKEYNSPTSVLLVRELLQNAVDACKEAGVEPKITIRIVFRRNPTSVFVSCEDNGIGMSEDGIVDDFLRLGKTGKLHNGQTGGFGIGAKSAVLSSKSFGVWSRDNYINGDIVRESRPVAKVRSRIGTLVWALSEDPNELQSWSAHRLTELIYTSDVSVNLMVYYSSKSGVNTILKDPEAGDLKFRPVSDPILTNDYFTAFLDMPINSKDPDFMIQGSEIFRMNGLTQFIDRGFGPRTTNLWFELSNQYRPETKEYPLNLSRETICGPTETTARVLITAHNINAFSSLKAAQKPEERKASETVRIKPGKYAEGDLSKKAREREERNSDPNQPPLTMGAIEAIRTFEQSGEVRNDIALMLYRYENPGPEGRKLHARMLRVWLELCQWASSLDQFGIGITTEEGTNASRERDDKRNIYYVLNPQAFQNLKPAEMILCLWHLSCHECAHDQFQYHDEYFTSEEGYLSRATAEKLWANMDRLIKMLKEK